MNHRSLKELTGEPTTATLRLFPGITGATIRAFLMPPTRGVVLETFGAGNAPQRADLVEALKEACDNGVIIVAITQCSKGSVSDAYETGRSLLQAGVVPGGDMTPEVRPFAAYRPQSMRASCSTCNRAVLIIGCHSAR